VKNNVAACSLRGSNVIGLSANNSADLLFSMSCNGVLEEDIELLAQ
jgi:hypothetical protein